MKKSITKFFATLMALCMICVTPVLAAEPCNSTANDTSAVESKTTATVSPRSNSFTYEYGKTYSVYLSTLTYGSSRKAYTGYGGDCIVNLRFTHSSGKVYTVAFTVDGTYHSELMGVSMPSGQYTVTMASSTGTFNRIMINFI